MDEPPKTTTRWTVREILRWTADYLGKKGISTGRLDAEILLAHCLGTDRLHLYLNMDRPLSEAERSCFRPLVRRRAGREPVALITGRKEFWSISLRTVPGILIPRPDTEILVEAVIEEIRDNPSPLVLEIGTGSGAVSLAVAKEKPGAQVTATDVDPSTVAVARLNAKEAGVSGSVDFLAADLFTALKPGPRFHVICSNPPYIPTDIIATLEPEIRDFEPLRALDGGADGLDIVRAIAVQATSHLTLRGVLFLEIGESQSEAVCRIFTETAGLHDIRVLRDLAGTPRVVKGRL